MYKRETGNHAIIICGGASYPALGKIEQITEDYVTTSFIGVDHGAVALIQAGYDLDYAVGDFDSVTLAEMDRINHYATEIDKHSEMKDDTDMELGIELAMNQDGEADYFIFGAIGIGGGRVDHLLANLWLVHQPRFKKIVDNMHFIEENHRFEFYQPGVHMIPPLMMPDYLSIVSLTPVKNLSIKGAKYNLPTRDFAYPRSLISNEFISQDQPITVSHSEGLLLVIWVDEE